MSPRIWPSSTRKSTPSSAMVVPKALRRPCASMVAIASALLFSSRRVFAGCDSVQQVFRGQAEPLNGRVDRVTLFRVNLLQLALQHQIERACIDEHAETSHLLYKLHVD